MTENERKPLAAVTGASRGIGRVTTWALARRGYRVFALARSAGELEEMAAEGKRSGLDVHAVGMDIADVASRQYAIASIFQATAGYGLDVLVNNAGYGQLGPLEEIPIEKFRYQLEVNVIGLLAFTQPFLAGMRSRHHGSVINVSSAAGRTAAPFMGAYNASKFALEGMSDALRRELHPFGVHVILIAPGPIRTEFGDAAGRMAEESSASPYAPYMRRWRRARRSSDLFGRSPEVVARAIIRAAESDHPRPRYTITLPAKLGAIGRRLIPDTVTDWALRRAMGRE